MLDFDENIKLQQVADAFPESNDWRCTKASEGS
jgi:hypothetical protein